MSAGSPPVIQVDVDGTMAVYTTWRGPEHFGPVIVGVRRALLKLIEHGYRVGVYTAREPRHVWHWLQDNDLDHLVFTVSNRKIPGHEAIFDDSSVPVARNTPNGLLIAVTDYLSLKRVGMPTTNDQPEKGAAA